MTANRWNLCNFWKHFDISNKIYLSWRLLLLWTFFATRLHADSNLKSNSGYYCYVRCLAHCVGQHGMSALETECKAQCSEFNDDSLCSKDDTNCWRTCRNTLPVSDSLIPAVPQNVTIAYESSPQPTPWEADLRWGSVEKSILYIVQNVDTTVKTWARGGLDANVTSSTHWRFVKPNLCPTYAFRVASVNENGVSSFSEVVNLSTPIPIVPAAVYSIKSAELLNTPFNDITLDNAPLYNTTVQLVISFAPPPNWIMGKDITKVYANLHILKCDRLDTFSPLIRQRPGEPEFEVRLPGWMAAATSECIMLFTVDSFITRCDQKTPVPYPDKTYDPSIGRETPGFTYSLSCKNIRHSVCPYSAISLTPACGVETVHYSFQRDHNYTSVVNTTVAFDRVLSPRDVPIEYYWIRFGEATKSDNAALPFAMADIAKGVDYLKIDNSSTHFVLQNLDVNKLYAFQICAIYRDTPAVDNLTWSAYTSYQVDLSSFITDYSSRDIAHGLATDSHLSTYVVIVAVPVISAVLIAMAVLTFIILRYKRVKSIDEFKVRPIGWDDDRYIIMPNRVDKWEIDRQDLIIYEDQKLGSGAFGSVYKCKLITPIITRNHSGTTFCANWHLAENGEAAVKLLPEYADETSKSDFRKEINLMKNLGQHERLVNMLGCVTTTEPLCLIVEYCQDGDLLHYLRDRRSYMIQLEEAGIDLNNLTDDEINIDRILCFKDLLSFAWQISVGLEYLSQKGYIHRDVAARNVLVDKGKKAKIGDFGLCRYSYVDSVYLSHGGRLPLKWMAWEAIKNYEFTTKSDVWSYGILLFEIITMGGNPYPGLQPADLEAYLEAGQRMEQPDNCPPILYAIMLDCWRKQPNDRPTFTQLRERLRVLLEEVTLDYSYLNLNSERDYYNVIPTDRENPSLTSAVQQTRGQASLMVEDENSKRPFQCANSADSFERPVTSCEQADPLRSPNALTPSAVLPDVSHRDSAGSDQLLITPTTPKFKFFKFKPPSNSKNGLAALPEASPDCSSDEGKSYTNGAYIDEVRHNAIVPDQT